MERVALTKLGVADQLVVDTSTILHQNRSRAFSQLSPKRQALAARPCGAAWHAVSVPPHLLIAYADPAAPETRRLAYAALQLFYHAAECLRLLKGQPASLRRLLRPPAP